ncbi:MAG TPA: porin [Trinickia sp.]|uniref:porin n=1 Tax=Trinickia sp. TaxID=2571163 RepID=UPI002CCBC84F|nr:porin [Trinickia sp.]HVW53597.1 porin [Trinickia sp.]
MFESCGSCDRSARWRGAKTTQLFCGAVLLWATSDACAQGTVQLYGIVDDALAYVSNEGGRQAWTQASGVGQSNRWGMRGVEELDGGWRALFRLENGFTINDGRFSQGGLEFGRQAFVGLSSDRFGTLTFGRQYDFMSTNLTQFAAATLTPSVFAFHLGDLDRLGAERVDNAARYLTPDIAGFQFGALYSFGGQPGNFVANSAVAFGATYARGSFRAGAAYVGIHNVATPFGIGTSVLGASLVGTGPQGLLSPFKVFDKLTVSGFGAGYQWGPAFLHALYTIVDFRQDGASASLRTAEGGVKYSLSFALSVAGSFAYSNLGDAHWNQIAAGIDYALSKRTDIYGSAVMLRASSGVRAQLFSLPAASSNSQTVVSVGLRHLF